MPYSPQIKKVQVDREHQLQDNEDLAGGDVYKPTSIMIMYLYLLGISLNHEPEIQEGWTQLQEKVGVVSGGVLEWNVCCSFFKWRLSRRSTRRS